MTIFSFKPPVDDISYPDVFMRKDKSFGINFTDLKTKLKFSTNTKQLTKIINNPGKPITTRKAYSPIDGREGNGQEMMAYFDSRKCFVIYVGKIGRSIKDLREDIATNGEIEIKVDIEHVKSILKGAQAHEYSIEVAEHREEERIEYLDSEVYLPEGKWYMENEINEDIE
ncbi:MAG: hypothetical protein U9N59_16610 [Campylobacterota bacterium]|nr:hypothetical protein [Campylobacterota bacterium]